MPCRSVSPASHRRRRSSEADHPARNRAAHCSIVAGYGIGFATCVFGAAPPVAATHQRSGRHRSERLHRRLGPTHRGPATRRGGGLGYGQDASHRLRWWPQGAGGGECVTFPAGGILLLAAQPAEALSCAPCSRTRAQGRRSPSPWAAASVLERGANRTQSEGGMLSRAMYLLTRWYKKASPPITTNANEMPGQEFHETSSSSGLQVRSIAEAPTWSSTRHQAHPGSK